MSPARGLTRGDPRAALSYPVHMVRRVPLPARRRLLSALAVGCALTAIATAAPARADEELTDARKAYDRGAKAYDDGDYVTAAREASFADQLVPNTTALELALKSVLRVELHVLAMQLADRIVLGYAAGDTEGNAAETAEWMTAEGFTSLRLVTAAYHMPRSLLEFQRALPGATIVAHPVFPPGVKQEGWWNDAGSTGVLVGEYLKYLLALISGPFRHTS